MNTIYSIIGFIIDHWTLISSILLFIFTTVYGYKNPKTSSQDYAKGVAQKLMFGLEKKAEEYLITNGAEKLKAVVENGYNVFPPKVRLFISKPDFQIIVQKLHDEAITFLEAKIEKQTPVVSTQPTDQHITTP